MLVNDDVISLVIMLFEYGYLGLMFKQFTWMFGLVTAPVISISVKWYSDKYLWCYKSRNIYRSEEILVKYIFNKSAFYGQLYYECNQLKSSLSALSEWERGIQYSADTQIVRGEKMAKKGRNVRVLTHANELGNFGNSSSEENDD